MNDYIRKAVEMADNFNWSDRGYNGIWVELPDGSEELFQTSQGVIVVSHPYLQQYWLDALYSGGAAGFQNLSPQSGVKSGTNTSEPGGIGRGWIVGGPTMNRREKSSISNGSKTRPRRGYGRGSF